MISRRTWRIRMTVAAKRDIQNILVWTSGHFGGRQARIYADTLRQAIRALTEGPQKPPQGKALSRESLTEIGTSS